MKLRLSEYTTIIRYENPKLSSGFCLTMEIISPLDECKKNDGSVNGYRYTFEFKDGILMDVNGNFHAPNNDHIMKKEFIFGIQYICKKYNVIIDLKHTPIFGSCYLNESYDTMKEEWQYLKQWNDMRIMRSVLCRDYSM